MAFVVYAGFNVCLVMVAALLCVYIGPSAAGSGIPEVKAYLNGVDTPNIFSIKTLIVKVGVKFLILGFAPVCNLVLLHNSSEVRFWRCILSSSFLFMPLIWTPHANIQTRP